MGIGHDTHRLIEGRQLVLGGVTIPFDRGSDGHSDGDALTHAITDAILGALSEGDLGVYFPDTDSQWKDADSMQLLSRVVWLARGGGFEIEKRDANVMLERPKLPAHIDTMRENLAKALNSDIARVSVKAKTGEGLNAVGQGEAVMAEAIVLLTNKSA